MAGIMPFAYKHYAVWSTIQFREGWLFWNKYFQLHEAMGNNVSL